jgi:hypothetical protein
MDLKELLNPVTEAHNIFDVSDKDICKAVMVGVGGRGNK